MKLNTRFVHFTERYANWGLYDEERIVIASEVLERYKMTIGIECHVQLKTRSKLFSGVLNSSADEAPNTTVSPICFGLPGVLPVLNEAAVDLAVRAGHALNAKISTFSKFDRKHYFYPDLPKGYQITQYDQPIVGKGAIEVPLRNSFFRVRIIRAHLEEDAGKLNHPSGADYTLVDLNRAGTPLLEIVSEPDMHSPEEAYAFTKELYLLMKYSKVSDVDLYQGNMRFDVNISIARHQATKLGVRTEIKNLNSFKNVGRASRYELIRQVELLEKNQPVVQETRGWDEARQKTVSQRGKEEAHDYRYFPEPDLPPLRLKKSYIDTIRDQMPILPHAARKRLRQVISDVNQIEVILDRPEFLRIMLEASENTTKENAVRIANWLANEVQNVIIRPDFNFQRDFKLSSSALIELAGLVQDQHVSPTAAKDILSQIIIKEQDVRELAEQKNLLQLSDTTKLEQIINKVIEDNPQTINDIKSGQARAIGFLIGQVMKASQGRANPKVVEKLFRKKIK